MENLILLTGPRSPPSSPLNLQYRPQMTVQTHGSVASQIPSPQAPQSTPAPQPHRQTIQQSQPQPIQAQALQSSIQPTTSLQSHSLQVLHGHPVPNQTQQMPLMHHLHVSHRPQFQSSSNQPQTAKVPHPVQLIQNSRPSAHTVQTQAQPHQLNKQSHIPIQPPPNAHKQQSQQHLVLPQQPQPIHLLQHPQQHSFHTLSQGQPMQLSRQPVQVVQRQHQQSVQLVAQTTFSCDLCGMGGIQSREALKQVKSQNSGHFSLNSKQKIVHFQHFLSHAAPRPFVCRNCDAGFVSKPQLDAHMKLHEMA